MFLLALIANSFRLKGRSSGLPRPALDGQNVGSEGTGLRWLVTEKM